MLKNMRAYTTGFDEQNTAIILEKV